MAAAARPWPGSLAVYRKTGPASFLFNRLIGSAATMGRLTSDLAAGPLHVFDRSSSVTVKLLSGALASVSEAELLEGANAAAIGSAETGWEIVQFAQAELVAARTCRISMLLRGQSGSDPEMTAARLAGERFVLINGAVVQPKLTLTQACLDTVWKIGPAQYDPARSYVTISHQCQLLGLRPLSPCQPRAIREAGGVRFSWIRRTRVDGDSWDIAEVPLGEASESYAVEIRDGSTVKRAAAASVPEYFYSDAAIASDFGTDPGAFTLRVAQVSNTFGPGAIMQRTIYV
jgi:hypothetical protein